jgi:hypothetical protein
MKRQVMATLAVLSGTQTIAKSGTVRSTPPTGISGKKLDHQGEGDFEH